MTEFSPTWADFRRHVRPSIGIEKAHDASQLPREADVADVLASRNDNRAKGKTLAMEWDTLEEKETPSNVG